ncbi:CU044_2847 family protein [Streptomyces phaeochromogenes]|uniref:CU044_2847 family protein n=1 Tax=Streptomyces phaeochromogenes TaxID=1923 RepID=UPI00340D0A05
MRSLVRIPLESGGSVLVEAAELADGPVKAGRVGDAIREMPVSLQAAMRPVADMARAVLDQLRQAGPDTVEVEFGVDLATQAGAVIARNEAGFHLKIRVLCEHNEGDQVTH